MRIRNSCRRRGLSSSPRLSARRQPHRFFKTGGEEITVSFWTKLFLEAAKTRERLYLSRTRARKGLPTQREHRTLTPATRSRLDPRSWCSTGHNALVPVHRADSPCPLIFLSWVQPRCESPDQVKLFFSLRYDHPLGPCGTSTDRAVLEQI